MVDTDTRPPRSTYLLTQTLSDGCAAVIEVETYDVKKMCVFYLPYSNLVAIAARKLLLCVVQFSL